MTLTPWTCGKQSLQASEASTNWQESERNRGKRKRKRKRKKGKLAKARLVTRPKRKHFLHPIHRKRDAATFWTPFEQVLLCLRVLIERGFSLPIFRDAKWSEERETKLSHKMLLSHDVTFGVDRDAIFDGYRDFLTLLNPSFLPKVKSTRQRPPKHINALSKTIRSSKAQGKKKRKCPKLKEKKAKII